MPNRRDRVRRIGSGARRGGPYASHIRGEGAHLFRAVDEAIEVGGRAEIPVHVSHLKCETSFTWGHADELLARVHEAGATGDQYPYAAWASVLWSLLPAWAPVTELPGLLDDRGTRARLIVSVERGEGDEFQSSVDGVGWDRIVIETTDDASCNGRIDRRDRHAARDRTCRCLLRAAARGAAHVVHRSCDARRRCPHDHGRLTGHGRLRRRSRVTRWADRERTRYIQGRTERSRGCSEQFARAR